MEREVITEESTEERATEKLWAKVPPSLYRVVESIAAEEDRTVSKTVRRLLEQSPRVKRQLVKATS